MTSVNYDPDVLEGELSIPTVDKESAVVPVYDFASVNLIRIRSGAKPWIGDKNHISHRLVRAGLSRRSAVLAIYALTGLTALPALLALRFDEIYWLAATALLLGLLAVADSLRYTPPD